MKAFDVVAIEKSYPGFRLGPLDLDLEMGSVMGFIGPNGAGKTTTLACLAGLVKPDRGSVTVLGMAADFNTRKWKQDIGYVSDIPSFYEGWSVARNLAFMSQVRPGWSETRATELVHRLGLPTEKRASDLSRGNRAKLDLVGALAHSPRLLLLDEPTGGLDPLARDEFLQLLWELVGEGETAVFYSTHILADIGRLADELAFVRGGQLILRADKGTLTGQWAQIAFHWPRELPAVEGIVGCQRVGARYTATTSDLISTEQRLRALGIESIEVVPLTLDDIAVHILRGESHVAVA